MARVRIEGVSVSRDDVTMLDDVTLDVNDGELVVVLGRSGAGKSTLLRTVAGLEKPQSGRVFIGDRDVTELDPSVRHTAMVFQENALFPFMTVRRNVSFPLEIQRTPNEEIDARVLAEARVLHIQELLERKPHQLSAGHQQLVQAARALVRTPDVFLMDEPLARLDARLRVIMRREFRLLQTGYGVTTLYVTNEPDEAMAIADRIVVLDQGRLLQYGLPLDVYHAPRSRRVAALVGSPPMSFVAGKVIVDPPGFWVEVGPMRIRAWDPGLAAASGPVEVGIRPEHVVEGAPGVRGRVVTVEQHGPSSFVGVEVAPDVVVPMRTNDRSALGDEIAVQLIGVHVFDPTDGSALGHVSGAVG